MPPTFQEALAARAIKRLLSTDADSRELAKLAPEIRERATFSARTTHLGYLAKMDKTITDVVSGELNPAYARLALKQHLEQIGYDPSEKDAKPGSLQDLSSDARTNLIIDTTTRQAWGYGNYAQGMDPDVLNAFPAQELIRVMARKLEREWTNRWRAAGGRFPGGRMIALKTDPIWVKISRFGLPYPPFDFQSGMGLQDIDREEAEKLGLIKPDQKLQPQSRGFNQDVKITLPDSLSPQLRADVLKAFGDTVKENGNKLEMVPSIASQTTRLAATKMADILLESDDGSLNRIDAINQAMKTTSSMEMRSQLLEQRAAVEQQREKLLERVRVEHLYQTPLEMKAAYKSRAFKGARKEEVEKGLNAFRALVGNKFTIPDINIKSSRADRSSCDPQKGLKMGVDFKARVVVHELGHWLEMNNPAILKAAQEMYRQRTKGEALQSLRTLTGIRGYKSHEVARPDKFYDPYMGKVYQSGYTEMVSMAIELYYADPIKLAKTDRATFIWIYELLTL